MKVNFKSFLFLFTINSKLDEKFCQMKLDDSDLNNLVYLLKCFIIF